MNQTKLMRSGAIIRIEPPEQKKAPDRAGLYIHRDNENGLLIRLLLIVICFFIIGRSLRI